MSTIELISAGELGLFYALVALGLFISYRILDIPDLTVDGSFTLGAACCAIFTIAGHPLMGFIVAIGAGALAGVVTATLQTKLKVQPILAGILTMTALYSINLMIMGNKSNVSLLGEETLFSKAKGLFEANYSALIVGVIVISVISIVIWLFLRTRLGLSIRATGDNEDMVRSSSINVEVTKTIGLAVANALVALSGALIAQKQGFSDATMGTGMVVIGLASLIIGEVIIDIFVKERSMLGNIIAAIIGSIIYRFIMTLALKVNISASSMKLVSAIIVGIAISYPTIKNNIILQIRIRRGKKHA